MWRYRDCLANGCRLLSKRSAPDVVCVWRLVALDRSRWWKGLLSLPFPTLAEARSTASQPVRKMRSKWPGSHFREIERLAAGATQMNQLHRWYCRSSRWKRTLDNQLNRELILYCWPYAASCVCPSCAVIDGNYGLGNGQLENKSLACYNQILSVQLP
jgi:hypothetical protein